MTCQKCHHYPLMTYNVTMSAETDPYHANLLRSYDNWDLYLHESQTYLGRSYIALKRDGEIDPFTDTTPDEQDELYFVVNSFKRTLDNLYQPDLLNYANLRNTWNHCHWHVIPRYQTPRIAHGQTFIDNNWGKNYAPYGEIELSNSALNSIRADLRNELNRAG